MNPNLKKQPRHKWFSAPDRRCEDGWYGPHDTMEQAIAECVCNGGPKYPVYVTQGRKFTKKERIENEDLGCEYDWECDSQNAFEIRLPQPNPTQKERDEK